jgi:hypothetical protein
MELYHSCVERRGRTWTNVRSALCWGINAALSGSSVPTFWDNLSVLPSRVKILSLDLLPLEDGIDCSETSAQNCHSTLRNMPDHLYRGGSLKYTELNSSQSMNWASKPYGLTPQSFRYYTLRHLILWAFKELGPSSTKDRRWADDTGRRDKIAQHILLTLSQEFEYWFYIVWTNCDYHYGFMYKTQHCLSWS